MRHDGKFYNFICSADENQWNRLPTAFGSSRVLEYTDQYIVDLFKPDGTLSEQVENIPTLFANEIGVGTPARIGKITSFSTSGADFVLTYELDENFTPIPINALEEMHFELGLNRFELSRTHWAIKHVDLPNLLEKRGFKVTPPHSSFEMTKIPKLPKGLQPSDPTKVFISYAHSDIGFLQRLNVHLKPVSQWAEVETWSDQRLVAGDDWRAQIENALEQASVAILLVSADFLASDFIVTRELPPLLKKSEEQGCRIVPVIVKPCLFTSQPDISTFQSINDPKESLLAMPEHKREETYARIAQLVMDAATT
ncbi:toll/interleukin-1 receptor domain-containing protein [Phaeobacter italicus]|uniref:toll/interleukin-1 receptor domain-containing protein n=1 Tax=Phaeobacter italicus TaxID=481446 RepID=UPI001AD9FD67|nr:toll/interleukin-1 receptor domain-containing protein [Phaeobacter italicus]MBO9441845.1 toll/interleukin-1 receptor domain-containing protein [Phaeobacter italicus]